MHKHAHHLARRRKHTLKKDPNRKLDWWNVPDEHPEEGLRVHAHTCAHQVQEVLRQSFRSPLQAFVFLEQNTDGRDLLRRAEIMLGLQRLGLSRVDPSELLQRLDPSESGVISVRAFLETLAWGLLSLPLFRTYFVCAPANKHAWVHTCIYACMYMYTHKCTYNLSRKDMLMCLPHYLHMRMHIRIHTRLYTQINWNGCHWRNSCMNCMKYGCNEDWSRPLL